MRWALLTLPVVLAACSEPSAGPVDEVVDGPLSDHRAIPASDAGGETLPSIGADGFRVLIRPTFGRYRYYVSFRQLPAGCLPRARQRQDGSDGQRVCGPGQIIARRIDRSGGQVLTAKFLIPVEEAEALTEELDTRLDRWRGTDAGWTDGTDVALERVRNGRVVSMDSNQPAFDGPDNPAAQLIGDLQRTLLAYGPTGFAPRSSNWDVRMAAEAEDSCNDPGLATPLDRGFGIGNSDCEAAKRWPS